MLEQTGEVGVNDGELDEDLSDMQQDQDDMHTCQDLSDDDIVNIGGNCADTISSLKEERQCCVYSLFTKETNYIYSSFVSVYCSVSCECTVNSL